LNFGGPSAQIKRLVFTNDKEMKRQSV
jgi:hypothetical protein